MKLSIALWFKYIHSLMFPVYRKVYCIKSV